MSLSGVDIGFASRFDDVVADGKLPTFDELRSTQSELTPRSELWRLWTEECAAAKANHRTPSIMRVSLSLTKGRIWLALGSRLLHECCGVCGPFVLREFVNWLRLSDAVVQSRSLGVGEGYLWAIGFIVINMLAPLMLAFSVDLTGGASWRVRAGLLTLIMEKSTRLPCDVALRKQGTVLSMYTTDTGRLKEAVFITSALVAPISVTAYCIAVVLLIGWSGLVAVALVLLSIPLQSFLTRKMGDVKRLVSKAGDRRVQRINEVLQSIRICKFMGWEEDFSRDIDEKRETEVHHLSAFFSLRSIVIGLSHSLTPIMQFSVFTVAYASGTAPTAATLFPVITILASIRGTMTSVALSIGRISDFNVAMHRISAFLATAERVDYVKHEPRLSQSSGLARGENVGVVAKGSSAAISVQNATWGAFVDSSLAGSGSFSLDRQRSEGPPPPGSESASPNQPNDNSTAPTAAAMDKDSSPGGQDERHGMTFVPLVRNVSGLEIPSGQLTMIVGATASGKSTLLNGLIGEVDLDPALCDATEPLSHGSFSTTPLRGPAVTVRGSTAYVPQDAWISNATIRENILLDQPFDAVRYADVLAVCQLIADLEQLPAADRTEIGERGINLSGGQKQRIALARAVYADRDVILMDDPLSAVDPHVAQHLVAECIAVALAGRTRVLVTHQVQFLPYADYVVCLEHGEVIFQGTSAAFAVSQMNPTVPPSSVTGPTPSPPSDRVATPRSRSEDGIKPGGWQCAEARARAVKAIDPRPSGDGAVAQSVAGSKSSAGQTITSEHQAIGGVPLGVYMWVTSLNGKSIVVITLIAFVLWRSSIVLGDLFLSWWTSGTPPFNANSIQPKFRDRDYILWSGICYLCTVLFVSLRQVFFVYWVIGISRRVHQRLLRSLLHAPMSFFDTTPMGRILNRFSKDMDTTCTSIPEDVNFLVSLVVLVTSLIVMMAVAAPYVAIAVVVVAFPYYKVSAKYSAALRYVRRLDNIGHSPIIALLQQSLGGLVSIRAYQMEKSIDDRHAIGVELIGRTAHAGLVVQLWGGIMICLIGSVVCATVAIFAVVLRTVASAGTASNRTQQDVVALALSYSASLTLSLSYFIIMAATLDSSMSAVERIKEYSEDVPQEVEPRYEGDEEEGSVAANASTTEPASSAARIVVPAPDPAWPRSGSLEFRDVCLRYREGLPLVLKNLSLNIASGKKVGVVGRTGSGKSTVMLALFRMVELASGAILLDGRDIATLKMADLRRQITIIPQDPTLFAGTIRSNLDPFRRHRDEVVWEAIDRVGLRGRLAGKDERPGESEVPLAGEPPERVTGGPGGLEAPVAEKGSNFSVGQRQLLCLARALLKKSKVLLLDEATASVDFEADAMIQRAIRSEFNHCTVLTIAHRIATVIDADSIIVLRDGQLAEFGAPADLLRKRRGEGVFRDMAEQLGAEQFQALVTAAERAAASS